MSFNLELPKISASSTEGKIKELQSYIFQLVSNLNWALNSLDTVGGGNVTLDSSTYEAIKSLVIKSPDVLAYFEDKLKMYFDEIYAQKENGTLLGVVNVSGTLKLGESNILDLIYPIGSVYESIDNSPPSFGTWVQIVSSSPYKWKRT